VEVKSDVVVSSDVGWLEMPSFHMVYIFSSHQGFFYVVSEKMSEYRIGCGVSSDVKQLEAFYANMFTRRKSRISCQS
jgi:hypothetical protein